MLKISLLIIGMISLIFILTSGISIQFKPFHISLASARLTIMEYQIMNIKMVTAKDSTQVLNTLSIGLRIKKKAKDNIFIARDKD